MEYAAFSFAIFAFLWISTLLTRINRLERKIKNLSDDAIDIVALKNFFLDAKGKNVKITFLDSKINFLDANRIIVRDVDDQWVLVDYVKKSKKEEKIEKTLIKLENIKSVEEVKEEK